MIKLTPAIKPVITSYTDNPAKKLVSLRSGNDIFGDLFINTQKSHDGINRFVTTLSNRCGKIFGKEIFSIDDNNTMFGFDIIVGPEYRNKNFKFGELLRLSSIIEIIENNAKNFGIYSKDTAVYFHSKYKFEPSITAFLYRDSALQAIIKKKNIAGYEDLVQKAEEIYLQCQSDPVPELGRKLCKDTNKLTKEYISRVLSKGKDEYKSHPFDFGMDMALPRSSILDNKEFFNTLFAKHGIDYEI